MKANIFLKEDKVICNIIDCEGVAKFKWHYQSDPSRTLNRIGHSTNIIPSFGYGTYICEIECNNGKIVVSNTFFRKEIIGQRENILEIPHQKNPPKVMEISYLPWDLQKIPEIEKEKVLDLIQKEEWKKLVIIHDKYNVSQNTYCCNMDNVKENFLKYGEMLRSKSQMVSDSDAQNAPSGR